MFDGTLFLEDCDLLESVNLECELVEEAGFIIDKKRLDDEDYVKELLSDVRSNKKVKYKVSDIVLLLLFAPVPLTPAAIPFCTLVNVILHTFITGLTKDQQEAKSKQKILTSLNKMITKYESGLSKIKDKDDKKDMENQIKRLKHNRDLIEKQL